METPRVARARDDAHLPVIVIGGGGHAKVLVGTLLLLRRQVLGFLDRNPAAAPVLGAPNLGDDDAVRRHAPEEVRLVNGIGSTASTASREAAFERFRALGFVFATVVHPSAVVADDVPLDDGAQVFAGSVVQPGSRLGADVIINTRACVDHDCVIGPHAHIAPGATLSGGVYVGRGAHIGTGATVIQGVRIGASAVVGAGAAVLADVPDGVTVAGVPARVIRPRSNVR